MAYDGMDVDAVHRASQQLSGAAGQLASSIAQIDGLIGQALQVWEGPDVGDFHDWWTGQHRPKLQACHQDLTNAATGLIHQVTDQERVSGGGAGASGAVGSVVGTAVVGAVAAAGATPTPAAVPGSASRSAVSSMPGPQHISNSAVADAAERELREHPERLETGWDKPGECMVSAQRWVKEAGGQVNPNGTVAGSYSAVATQVPLSAVARGDVLQYVDPANPNGDWAHVHTVVVTGVNPDGTYNIIERNYDTRGSIRAQTEWRPQPHDGWETRAYRYGDQP